MLYLVIYKDKKVALSFKSSKADGANKIYVNKLISVFCSFLLAVIVHFCDFGCLETIINEVV